MPESDGRFRSIAQGINLTLLAGAVCLFAAGLSAESQFTTVFMAILSTILGALADWLGVGPALACLGGTMLVLGLLARVETKAHKHAGLGKEAAP